MSFQYLRTLFILSFNCLLYRLHTFSSFHLPLSVTPFSTVIIFIPHVSSLTLQLFSLSPVIIYRRLNAIFWTTVYEEMQFITQKIFKYVNHLRHMINIINVTERIQIYMYVDFISCFGITQRKYFFSVQCNINNSVSMVDFFFFK